MNSEKQTPELPSIKSIPINNYKHKKISNSYDLKLNTFDPNKCSPPNNWNARLYFRFYGETVNMRCKKIAK